MDSITLDILKYLFSHSRISPYLKDSNTAEEALNKYHVNIKLSEAMIPALHYLEVCLRNRLDQLFCVLYGEDWFLHLPKDLMISPEDVKKIQKIVSRIERECRRKATHGDVISQMTFGFWYSFFHVNMILLFGIGKILLLQFFLICREQIESALILSKR